MRKESNKESTWHADSPEKEGAYICRMADAYIKMCYWNTIEWKDMWKDTPVSYTHLTLPTNREV